tara:strand:- start:354 stop:500 length:147 start_codon:yes stop_codon:yes gene_type:complete
MLLFMLVMPEVEVMIQPKSLVVEEEVQMVLVQLDLDLVMVALVVLGFR